MIDTLLILLSTTLLTLGGIYWRDRNPYPNIADCDLIECYFARLGMPTCLARVDTRKRFWITWLIENDLSDIRASQKDGSRLEQATLRGDPLPSRKMAQAFRRQTSS